MGQLSKIIETRRKSKEEALASLPAAEPAELAKPPEEKPCSWCNGKLFWESIYADSVWRCETCEPPPAPEIIGRRIGQQPEKSTPEPQAQPQQTVQGITDLADLFVEYTTADGRTGIARRGFDNPRGPNYDQRVCAYVAIGVTEYDRMLEQLQTAWREELVR